MNIKETSKYINNCIYDMSVESYKPQFQGYEGGS